MTRPTPSLPFALTALALGVTLGCSNQQVYESLQAGKRNECQRLAQPERSKCLESGNLKYDDYARERDKAQPNPD